MKEAREILAGSLASALADELDTLCARLRRVSATKARRRSPSGKRGGSRSRPGTRPTGGARTVVGGDAAVIVLGALRARGKRSARLVSGAVQPPGAGRARPHRWVEVDDEVHDPSLEDGRRVWPRELYYLVFRPVQREAA